MKADKCSVLQNFGFSVIPSQYLIEFVYKFLIINGYFSLGNIQLGIKQ